MVDFGYILLCLLFLPFIAFIFIFQQAITDNDDAKQVFYYIFKKPEEELIPEQLPNNTLSKEI